MWQTFEVITEYIEERDCVTFDITHGLRSLPFLVFLFAAYLKEAKRVEIASIYYGALELGDAKEGIPAPVIDLSEFVEMLDWLTATQQFVDLGNGKALSTLLKQNLPSSLEVKNDRVAQSQQKQLKNLSNLIELISLALQLARPIETMESAAKLEPALNSALGAIAQRAKPFQLLAGQVAERYGQFALDASQDLVRGLRQQLVMVGWYVEKQQIVQAATLAREWIVSVLVLRSGRDILDKNERSHIEDILNQAAYSMRNGQGSSTLNQFFSDSTLNSEVVSLWEQMTQLRNDIAHVGMRSNASKAVKLDERMTRIYGQLEKLVEKFLHFEK